jgi:hypothetical protein|tara:strand:- start:1370 stop:1573 length:204 start_codon:yes stop_codon:yes gene_type:complete
MREYYDNDKYPSPSPKKTKAEPSFPSTEDTTKTKSVEAGYCLDEPEKAKVKAAYGQKKGLLWYRSVK